MTQQLMTQEPETLVLHEWEKPLVRRGFLGFMGKVGVATIGAASGMIALAGKAAAAPPCTCTNPNFACCSLNLPNDCPIDQYGGRYCPDNTIGFVWTCCFCGGSRTYTCMECMFSTGNGTCCQDLSNTRCSAYWTASPNSCTCNAGCGCANVQGCWQ